MDKAGICTPLVYKSTASHVQPKLQTTTQIRLDSVFSPLVRQMFVASGAIIAAVTSGMTNGFSATALPQLMKNNSSFSINEAQGSWIAGIVALPMPIGGIVSGIMMENYGRRFTQIFCCFPLIIGWLLLYFASNVEMLYIGRFLTGFCIGLSSPSATVYIAETSEPRYRGFILSFISLGISFGVLLAHILGTYFFWQDVSLISSAVPFVGLVLLCFSPETPNWLIHRGCFEEAERTFYWLRANSHSSDDELRALLVKHSQKKVRITRHKFLKNLTSYMFLQPFIITAVFFFIQQFSGVNTIIFYSVNILQNVSLDLNEYTFMMIIDVVRVIMSVVGCMLLKKYARRPLFLFSSIGSIFFIFALAAYLQFWKDNSVGWLPIIFINMYIIFSSIGLTPLPWIMTGEVYPEALRDFGSGVSNCFAFIMIFVVVKTAPFLFSTLQISGTFFMYGIITSAGTLFLYFFLPETSNKTLQEVEDNLRNNTRNRSNI